MNKEKKICYKAGILPKHPPASTNASNTSAQTEETGGHVHLLTQFHTQ